jgi:phosphohistidine phosphatase
MKVLYLVRHAKAVPADVGVNDFKRALTKSGRHDAQAMSERLRKKGILPELFISSPADRALETAHIFAKTLGYPLQKIELKDEIYENIEDTLQNLIKGLDERYSTVMLFGHHPSLSSLASHLVHDFDAEIRVSGVVGIAFDVATWQAISADFATLRLFDFPIRITPKTYKKAQKTIEHDIISTMEDLLEDIDLGATRHLDRILQKTSKKLAKQMLKVLKASKVEEIAGQKKLHRVDNLPTNMI